MVQGRVGWVRGVLVGVAAAVLLFAGGWSAARAQDGVDMPIQGFVFAPDKMTVPVGTTITWTNHDPVDHTVTDVNQLWDSGLFGADGTFSKTFDAPGTYTYYCIPHPTMIGIIEVQ